MGAWACCQEQTYRLRSGSAEAAGLRRSGHRQWHRVGSALLVLWASVQDSSECCHGSSENNVVAEVTPACELWPGSPESHVVAEVATCELWPGVSETWLVAVAT